MATYKEDEIFDELRFQIHLEEGGSEESYEVLQTFRALQKVYSNQQGYPAYEVLNVIRARALNEKGGDKREVIAVRDGLLSMKQYEELNARLSQGWDK